MRGFTSSQYYSLALQYFSFGPGFPYDTRPFCSAHSVCSSSFYTIVSQVQFNIIHPSSSRSSLFSPSPGLPYGNIFTFLSLKIPTTWPSHFNMSDSITITVSADLIFCINFLFHIYSPVTIFVCWPIYFYTKIPNKNVFCMIQNGFNTHVKLLKIIKERLCDAKPRILKAS